MRLVCAVGAQLGAGSLQQDFHIQPQGPQPRVLQVQAIHVIEGQSAASAHPPQYDNAGLDLESKPFGKSQTMANGRCVEGRSA